MDVRVFAHGTTTHGLQVRDERLSLEPQSYYAGVAPVLARFVATRRPATIGITGLGTGTLACLGQAGDQVTYFEIDPAVEAVAREYFTFLERCPPAVEVVLGDARLKLASQADGRFDLLVLDAFSSDSVPVHLLTNEAVSEYERVLAPDGLMVFHISNRYLDLEPVLARLAAHRGWTAWSLTLRPGPDQPLAAAGVFVLTGSSDLSREWLDGPEKLERLPEYSGFPLWTDDHSNLLRVLRW